MNETTVTLPVSERSLDKGGLKVEKREERSLSENEKIKKGICPSCESSLIFQEGCKMCICCGWGGCS
ncbi:MAG: hypothetical protein ABIJ10_05595 [Candidatus Micrarchaeota archaeon]|nr:hypothetical protein [Candidatus Micrarchaeota archaeon]MBU1886954.1 hypothetical protein [Candidatus Micrarchaeota archaeon]